MGSRLLRHNLTNARDRASSLETENLNSDTCGLLNPCVSFFCYQLRTHPRPALISHATNADERGKRRETDGRTPRLRFASGDDDHGARHKGVGPYPHPRTHGERRGITPTHQIQVRYQSRFCQSGRRNLSTYNRAQLALQLEPLYAAENKRRMEEGRNQYSPRQKSDEGTHMRTDERLANLAGTSRDTIRTFSHICPCL